MKALLLVLSIFLCSLIYSQEENVTQEDTTVYRHEKSMMIIPFEPKMYRSEIDQELAQANNKTYDAIVRDFRYGSAFQFQYEMLYRYKAFSLVNMVEDSVKEDLEIIYSNIGYDYVPIDDTVGYANSNRLEQIKMRTNNALAKSQNPDSGTRNGEIVSERDTRKKYMKTVIKSDTLLPYLNYRYECDYYLFINQIDLINDLSDPDKVALGEWDRKLQIHFTIFDSNGKIVEEGLLEKALPKDENDINTIVKVHIKDLARRAREVMGAKEKNQEVVGEEPKKPVEKKVIKFKDLKKSF